MTEKAEKEKKSGKNQAGKAGGNTKITQKGSSGSENGSNGSNGGGVDKSEAKKKSPPSVEDLKRYETYVGQKWTGRCRWFNVVKGFGFIDPYFEEAKQHDDDVFVHQSALQMEGFRSLDENEDVEFIVALGKNGLEAADVKGMNGVALRGHSIRPKGRKQGDKLIRCFKCGKLGHHQASRCKIDIPPKACYQCHSSEHQLSECPEYLARKQEIAEQKKNRSGRSKSGDQQSGKAAPVKSEK